MIDRDVVNLIHYLRWDVKLNWDEAERWLFCPPDTFTDADDYLTAAATNFLPL
jgi:hypothetical protein